MANEKRLIDANALLEENCGDCSRQQRKMCENDPVCGSAMWIVEAPTVDAVEMPCKIGDMVHRKDGQWTVVGFECDRTGSWRVKLERWKDRFCDYHETTKVLFKSFGKTVFPTSKEAAVALAKMYKERKIENEIESYA